MMIEAIHTAQVELVATRSGVINMHSLVYNQLQSYAYQDMMRYAWHKTDPGFRMDELAIRPRPCKPNVENLVFWRASDHQKAGFSSQGIVGRTWDSCNLRWLYKQV